MTTNPLWRRALAEFTGTGLLVTVVVGSGVAAQRLTDDAGLQLLANSLATALGLSVLVVLLAPVSGAHLNPVVSAIDVALGRNAPETLRARDLTAYLPAQIAGGISGALLANAMFGVPLGLSSTSRATPATVLAEVVATAGLALVVFGLSRAGRPATVIGPAVGAYIGAAYWFTSSTSFANPAVTIGRVFTDSFAGVSPVSAGPFLLAQFAGAMIGASVAWALFPRSASSGVSAASA